MAKKSWPTQSKGTFYKGFSGNEGLSPTERSMQTVSASANKQDSVKGRLLHPASKKLTAMGMRKPN